MTLLAEPDTDTDWELWAKQVAELEQDWATWLSAVVPSYCGYPMAQHHVTFWDWLWSIDLDATPPAFIAVWARGGAKSTSAEAGCVALGARGARRYGLYVCDTQDRADDHVQNVAAMLESEKVGVWYPDLGERRVGKYGSSRGWRRNRIWTDNGFVIDAIGLDSAAHGVKLEDQRPDFLVFDDIDGRHDSADATRRKVETITEGIIPAGSENVAILGIQNLIIPKGVFAQLVNGSADFLRRRIVSGPIPTVVGMRTAMVEVEVEPGRVETIEQIVEGEPTWAGQSIPTCNRQIADQGMRAFRRERQHEVGDAKGALWKRDQIEASRVLVAPDMDVCIVSVDPSGGHGKNNDDQGIIAVGRGVDGHVYVLEDHTCSLSPAGWGKTAVRCAVDLNADRIIVEDNYGGEAMAHTIRVAADALVDEGIDGAARFGGSSTLVQQKHAGHLNKAARARPVAGLYGEKEQPETWPHGKVHHVGVLPELEDEQTSWEPDTGAKSPNRIDALTHGVDELGVLGKRKGRRSIVDTEAA